jgi:hypothetical protein
MQYKSRITLFSTRRGVAAAQWLGIVGRAGQYSVEAVEKVQKHLFCQFSTYKNQ